MNFILNSVLKYFGAELARKLASAIVGAVSDWFVTQAIKKSEANTESRDKERDAMMQAIASAQDNEQRRVLSIALAKLHRMDDLKDEKE